MLKVHNMFYLLNNIPQEMKRECVFFGKTVVCIQPVTLQNNLLAELDKNLGHDLTHCQRRRVTLCTSYYQLRVTAVVPPTVSDNEPDVVLAFMTL